MLPSVKAASHTHTPSLPPSLPCAHTHRLALQKHGSSLVIDQNITTYRLSCQALTWSHNTSRIFQFFLSFSLSFHPFVRSGSSLHYLQLYFPYLSLKSIFLFLIHPPFALWIWKLLQRKTAGVVSPLHWAASLPHRATFGIPAIMHMTSMLSCMCAFPINHKCGFCPNTHDTRWMHVRKWKRTTGWKTRWWKPGLKWKQNKQTKKKASGDKRCGQVKVWTTGTGRREDRTLRLRIMLFNLWIRPGLEFFTLICVFIDFVFNFNLTSVSLPSHPLGLFYAPKGFFT